MIQQYLPCNDLKIVNVFEFFRIKSFVIEDIDSEPPEYSMLKKSEPCSLLRINLVYWSPGYINDIPWTLRISLMRLILRNEYFNTFALALDISQYLCSGPGYYRRWKSFNHPNYLRTPWQRLFMIDAVRNL